MSTLPYKLSVKSPCQQDWNGMLNTNDGRFCNSCEKEVIDFTKLSNDEVISYIKKNGLNGGCGRFLNTQLETININFAENTFGTKISFWKKFVAILMVCFAQQIFNAQVSFSQTVKKDSTISKTNCDTDALIESPPLSLLDSIFKPHKLDSSKILADSTISRDSTPIDTTIKETTIKINPISFTMGSAIISISDTIWLTTTYKPIHTIGFYVPYRKLDLPIDTDNKDLEVNIVLQKPTIKNKLQQTLTIQNNNKDYLEKNENSPKKDESADFSLIAILPNEDKKKKKKK